MFNILKRKVSSFVFNRSPIGDFLNGVYDTQHHRTYSFREKELGSDKAHLKYYLTKHYHIIEKGLALPEPRYGFGQPKILDVIHKAKVYQKNYGNDKL
ncbi:MAG: hypothetical protein GX995_08820, partial [Clostridiales bacterium]|nr:hypothetical protein [Clostridiales bacterium]